MNAIGHREMAQHDGAAAEGAVRADGGAAGHADAARHGGVLTDAHVVADLDQVVQLDAVFDEGVVERAAIDAGVGADLDVVADAHRAQLLDLHPRALVRRQAEAVGADHHAGMQQAALADHAVLADRHARLEDRAGADACAPLHHAQGADARGGIHTGFGMDDRGGMDAIGLGTRMVRLPELRQASEIEIRVGGDDECTARRRRLAHGGRNDHAGGLGRRQFLLVFGMAQETERIGLRILKRRKPLDGQRRVAVELAPKGADNGSELQCHAVSRRYLPPAGAEEAVEAFSALITLSVMSCFGLM
jgi:hypothetical protein